MRPAAVQHQVPTRHAFAAGGGEAIGAWRRMDTGVSLRWDRVVVALPLSPGKSARNVADPVPPFRKLAGTPMSSSACGGVSKRDRGERCVQFGEQQRRCFLELVGGILPRQRDEVFPGPVRRLWRAGAASEKGHRAGEREDAYSQN